MQRLSRGTERLCASTAMKTLKKVVLENQTAPYDKCKPWARAGQFKDTGREKQRIDALWWVCSDRGGGMGCCRVMEDKDEISG